MNTAIRQRGAGALAWLVGLAVIAGLLLATYVWAMMSWSYSDGERAGWVQKLSKKGWVCKTWEGEMAMVSMPGAIPEKFLFTVRSNAIAEQINANLGRRVSLHYEEHIGLPTTCFGETRHFVKGVKSIEDGPAPMAVNPAPAAPAAAPPSAAPPAGAPPADTQPKQ